MPEFVRHIRWLFVFRLLTLGVAVLLLPSQVAMARPDKVALSLWIAGLIALWSVPLWHQTMRREPVLGLLALIEAVVVSVLVGAYGRLESPFALLYLPVLAQAAALLPSIWYTLVAAVCLAGYGLAVLPSIQRRYLPDWTPILVASAVMLVAWLGVMGAGYRRERLRGARATRQLNSFRELVESLTTFGRDERAWRDFLRRVAHSGGFLDAAVIVWEGPRARVISLGWPTPWEGLLRRHHAVFQHRIREERQPEIFVETLDARPARSMVIWPIAALPQGEEAAGALCLIAPRIITVPEAEKALRHWLPLAALGLAASRRHLKLERAPVDWQVLMNVTLHRLHSRLAQYLVMVHVEPGLVEADALMVADAIARVIEDALDRVPPHSRVYLDVRRSPEGWRFEVRTEPPTRPPTARDRAGLALAQQVVAAHGGEWRALVDQEGYRVGFTLPAEPEGAQAPQQDDHNQTG